MFLVDIESIFQIAGHYDNLYIQVGKLPKKVFEVLIIHILQIFFGHFSGWK